MLLFAILLLILVMASAAVNLSPKPRKNWFLEGLFGFLLAIAACVMLTLIRLELVPATDQIFLMFVLRLETAILLYFLATDGIRFLKHKPDPSIIQKTVRSAIFVQIALFIGLVILVLYRMKY